MEYIIFWFKIPNMYSTENWKIVKFCRISAEVHIHDQHLGKDISPVAAKTYSRTIVQ
jgi:hypothetical protein